MTVTIVEAATLIAFATVGLACIVCFCAFVLMAATTLRVDAPPARPAGHCATLDADTEMELLLAELEARALSARARGNSR